MSNLSKHTFHIPVMGIAFTIDTPIKLAHFGISSVVSIIEDQVIEDMRKLYSSYEDEEFQPIPDTVEDYRAKRITAYLNLLDKIVLRKTEDLRKESFESGYSIQKYFEMRKEKCNSKNHGLKVNLRSNIHFHMTMSPTGILLWRRKES